MYDRTGVILTKNLTLIMEYNKSDNFSVTTFNCKGFKYKNYDFLKSVFDECSILLLQEHWLHNFEFNNFEKVLKNCCFHAKSSMRDNELVLGRCYGGTAILWKKDLNATINIVETASPRLTSITCHIDSRQLLIISVYMPDNVRIKEEEFNLVLAEITSLCMQYDGYECIVGGDFNCDFVREDDRGDTIKSWAEGINVNCPSLMPQTVRAPTFYTPAGNSSVLDYVFMTEQLLSDVVDWKVYDRGDNLSDHCPKKISLRWNIEILINEANRASSIISAKPQWKKATREQKRAYQVALDEYLSQINIPCDAMTCNNIKDCDKHYFDFTTFLDRILSACERATKECIPHSKPRNSSNGIPGWNEHVREKRESSLFWHERWKEQGRPGVGWLADMRKRTRTQYHLAVKSVKKNKDSIVKNRIAESLYEGNSIKFWANINKMKTSKTTCSQVIDGYSGTDACNIFKVKYENLYNKVQGNNNHEVRSKIQEEILCKCGQGKGRFHLHSVKVEHVQKAILSLKTGQLDNNCMLISDSFIFGSYRLQVMLAFLFTIMIRHGFTCNVFNIVALIPIPKNKRKSLADSENYRAIAPNSSLAKVLDYIIIQQFPDVFVTDVQQFAYKAGFSTTMCTFMVLETIQYYRSKGSNVYVTLLDCSKAFDMVNFDKLFICLLERDLCPLVTRLLFNIYSSSEYYIKWNNMSSEKFPISNGVKQGGVLSPLLFAMYTDPLIGKVRQSGLGCHIGNKCASIFVYADDIILLTPSRFAMQALISICENYAEEYNLKYNPSKCKVMIFSNSFNNNIRLVLNGTLLSVSPSEKHLGHMLSSVDEILDYSSIIIDIKVRSNCIKREFNFLDTNSKTRLFNAQCTSFYGCQLMDLQSNQFKELERSWRVSVRYLLGLEPRTHSIFLPGLTNSMSASAQIHSRMLCFLKK